ncbi:MAG: lipoyl(octanoyl) transferase LipB [Candidatus Dormibacteria bacterium]
MPYRQGWSLQRRLAQARRSGEITDDCLLLLEHPPTYTMGRTGEAAHLGAGVEHLTALGADYLEVDRGGSVTFHGPGQLVAYPIVRVPDIFPLEASRGSGDVIRYVRSLEQAVIATVGEHGIVATARPPHTGVWVGGGAKKLASIGVKVAGGVSTHGIALNVSTDLDWFSHIVPCGIAGAAVTSLDQLGARCVSVRACSEQLAAALAGVFGSRIAEADEALRSLVAAHLHGETLAA